MTAQLTFAPGKRLVPGRNRMTLAGEVLPIRGLNFDVANGNAGANVALIWDGSSYLDRGNHVAIGRYFGHTSRVGYSSLFWHSRNTGSFDGGVFSMGTSLFPGGNGSVDGNGDATNGQSDSGTTHYPEIAVQADDYLRTSGESPGYPSGEGAWKVWVRKCRGPIVGGLNDGLYEHVLFPDRLDNPTRKIQQFQPAPATAGADPAFYVGSSDWAPEDEAVYGIARGLQLYSGWLDDADDAIEAANILYNAAQTVAGRALLHYINQSPTPLDTDDKKTGGTAHPPRWRNANRPTLWTP